MKILLLKLNTFYPFLKHTIRLLFLLIITVNFSYATPFNDQSILDQKVNVFYKKASLSHVLSDLEDKAGISFIYVDGLIPDDKKIEIEAENWSLEKIFNTIFSSLQIEYHIEGNQVVLKKTSLNPEKGIIVGTIVSEGDGEALPFASIQIQGTSRGVVCDNQGKFRLAALSPGRYTLVVSFVGYEKIEKEVDVEGNATIEILVELPNLYKEMEGVTISGIRKGEIKALTKMKNSENIKYILSQEQIERFPDLTVGESLQRAPGVAVGYSYGIPNEVIIRGLGQSLSSIQINGNRIPSTTTGGRTTDLNGILSNTIESIEVVKTLTPDQDADGTGGTVNIVTKQATTNQPIFDARASVGYNNLVNKGNYELGVTYGRKPGKLGYLVSASYMRSNRGQERIQKEYDDFELSDGSTFNGISEIRLSSHDLRRDNLGVNADLNYDASDKFKFYLRGSYNYYYELQFGPELRYGINAYTEENITSEVSISKERNWRDYNRSIFSVSGGGAIKLAIYEVRYDITYSKGIYDQPIYFGSGFSRNGSELRGVVDVSDNAAPTITFPEDMDVLNPADFSTNRYINRHDQSQDQDIQFSMDVSRPLKFLGQTGTFKFGGKYRHKYNDRSRRYFLHDLKEGEFVLADYLDPYSNNDFFGEDYAFENFPDAEMLDDFYHSNPGLFLDNENYTRQNTDPDSFEGNEYLFASYLMSTLNFGPLELVAGVRYEQTGFDYKGNSVSFDADGNYIRTIPVNTDDDFSGFFPSLNLRYAVSKNTNIRAAVTRSLVRPDYYDLVPWEEVLFRNERVNRGNPDLTQATSVNVDGLFEHYFQSVGLLSGGVFHKKIKDYLYETSYTQTGGVYDGYRVDQVLNGADASVYGFELAWQQQLTFLPGVLNGLGIYLNYTYIQSEFTVPGIETDREVALPEMRPHVGNVSLSYEKFGFSGRISAYFYDHYITSLAENPADDEYEKERIQLDFSASQKISPRISIYTGLSNISNAPSGDYFGSKSRPFTDFRYSWWGNIGFRYSIL